MSTGMRETFVATVTDLIDRDPRTAVVLAGITVDAFQPAARRHPHRVLNVGIREQLMLGVAGGLALTGIRPFAHSYAPFLVDRAYEQIKLDLGHQAVGAVLVSIGASYDASAEGYTHLSPGDVSLLDTLGGWTVHVPGHADEVAQVLTAAAAVNDPVYVRLSTQRNDLAYPVGRLHPVHRGSSRAPVVVAVGPMLRPVLHAIAGWDVTVAYTNTVRPFDHAGLRALVGDPAAVALVEPTLAGTSVKQVSEALSDLPHRTLALGVGVEEIRRYGAPADHARWHGLDPGGLRRSLSALVS